MAALVPARVLPLGRGAWFAGFGVAGVRWLTFAMVDGFAVAVFLLVWCGLGWWLGARAEVILPLARPVGLWLLLAVVARVAAVLGWRRLGARLRSRDVRA